MNIEWLKNKAKEKFYPITHAKAVLFGENNRTVNDEIDELKNDLTDHESDTIKHITSTERTNWNSAKTHADSAHAPSNAQVNVIETIKVNGTALTPSSKAVNITVPTNNNQLTNGAGYITSSGTAKTISDTLPISKGGTGQTTGENAANALINSLGEGTDTPSDNDYYISQWAGGGTTHRTYYRRPVSALWNYIKSKLATVAMSGSYNDLKNKPTIPTVGNGTITIKQAGTSKGTFTMNQSGNTTIELTDNNTTYGVATSSSLGLVKSGTDITVDSSGNVSVNDDSHNHVISNVDGLQSTLDGKAPSSHKQAYTSLECTTYTADESTVGITPAAVKKAITEVFEPKSHTHSYAGSSSAGGSATSAVKLDSSAGSATQPVYFSSGKPVACTYTLGKSVPSDAVFTDTNTWRGIQNNLTSDSTTDSLSAAQGKVLKGLVDGKAASNHTHSQYLTSQDISGKLDNSANGADSLLSKITSSWTAIPTDDTYFIRQDTGGANNFGRVKFSTLWSYVKGKADKVYAALTHTHTKSEVGLGNVDNTADSAKSVKSSKKLQTYKQGSTTETYGDNYPIYAQWRDSSHVKMKCDNFTVETDYATSAGSASSVAWNNISGKPSTYTPSSHTHTKSQITDFPTSLPASDVYSWAKASSKPSYSWSEITNKPSSFTPASHNHELIIDSNNKDTPIYITYSKDELAYDGFTYLTAWYGYELRKIPKTLFATASHTHSYLPLSGGTVSGTITADNLQSKNGLTLTNTYSTADASIKCYWKDNSLHEIVTRNSNGLSSYFGWAGSSRYSTTTWLRGQTCKYQNASGTATLSDVRMKKDFRGLDVYDKFFDAIEPCAFRMTNGSSGRYHIGYKAQQIEQALIDSGLTTQDFAGFIRMPYTIDKEDKNGTKAHEEAGIKEGDDELSIIYTEFAAMNTYQIQKCKKEISNLKNEIAELKNIILNLNA